VGQTRRLDGDLVATFTATSSGSGIYEDMAGNQWGVYVNFPNVTSFDGPYYAELRKPAYGQPAGKALLTSLIYASKGTTANKAIIKAIEEYGQRWRDSQRGSGMGWLFALVIGYMVLKGGKQ